MPESIVLFGARFLSIFFHPLLIALPVPYWIILRSTNKADEAVEWTFISWIFVFMIALFLFREVRMGKFTNWDVSQRKQRPLLFLFVGAMSVVYISSLLLFHGPIVMLLIVFGMLIGLLALDIINMKIKASIHVAAVASILLAIVLLKGIEYSWLLLFIPFVAWSRVKLHRHTVTETFVGGLFGLFLTLFIYVIIVNVFK